ncbi:SDR family NAD(P)-dependent oxidoreductase [Paenibacillus massiliensis]|uniref:SDR family NAD(P)-dependent oxidoreductase n=1 Tax=Paenibacillus massiliensis TaxID=225917 RepID=UPI00040FC83D|nr:SDR family oxidoreductase [Paenibacillus massiliensis]
MLQHMKVIVTGSGSGIGKAITLQCLQEGAAVMACDINEDALTKLQADANTEQLSTYRLDISAYEDVSSFFAYISEKHPDVNGLVNNAGIYLGKSLLNYTPNEMAKVMNVNVMGSVYVSRCFGEMLLQQQRQGTIVNMSSVSGLEGSSDAVYGMSKAAILGLTKSCAMNFAPYIRVNAVAPTMVDTSMMEEIPVWRKEEYLNHQLIKQPLSPESVADTVIFLLSDKSRHYTGATFDINNGGYLR